jgi:hypothetical protein
MSPERDLVLADDRAEADLLGVVRGHLDGHVVVEDLDRQILALLAEHLPQLLLHDRACPMVRIDHLVADLVQARPLFRSQSPKRRPLLADRR